VKTVVKKTCARRFAHAALRHTLTFTLTLTFILPSVRAAELLPPRIAGPAQWTAHWIVAPEAPAGTNLMFLARRSFTLSSAPERAVLYITADNYYQVFVNGVFVRRGPARSAAHHQSYDALDVASFLRAGKNTLAVRFHHAGITPAYRSGPRAGLLAQLEWTAGGVSGILGTDPQWKAVLDPAWDRGSPRMNNWLNTFVDVADLRKRPDSWTSPDFNDAAWPAAGSNLPGGVRTAEGTKAVPGISWWPSPQPDYVPQAISPPWVNLVSREVPLLVESTVPATRTVLTGRLEDPAAAQPRTEAAAYRFDALPPLKLPPLGEASTASPEPLTLGGAPGQSDVVVFDLGEVHNGYPRLDLEGPAGAIVDVLATPYVLNRTFDPTILNTFAGDRLILSGKREQWEAFFFKPTRYLALVVRGATSPVRIHHASVTRIDYPWNRPGAFAAPGNPWLERFWRAGAKTVEVITTDAYTDNYRERRQYPQTSYYAARGNYAAFGDTFLQRRYLLQNAEEQEPDGALGGYAPVTDGRFMPFLDVQFFWIMSWRDYLLYSGDDATTRRLLPNALRVMQRLAEQTTPDGLLTYPVYPYWIDHAYLDRRGAHFTTNALYALTLDDCAQTLDWLGEPGAPALREAAARIRETLRTKLWVPARGLFAENLSEGKLSPRFSEHANAIAVAARIATPEQTSAILPKLLKLDADVVPATSLFVYWTMAALCLEGRVDAAAAMLQERFDHQFETGNGTLWEEWHLDRTYRQGVREKNSRADAQGECGIFPEAVTRWVAGLEPVTPGQRDFTLRRPATALRDIAATWPTPRGNLRVTWSEGALAIDVPVDTTVRLNLESLRAAPGSLRIDGLLEKSGQSTLPLTTGTHRLTFQPR